MIEKVLDLIFPPTCFGCGISGSHFCGSCLRKCLKARHFYCVMCDKPSKMGETHTQCLHPHAPLSIFRAYEYKGLVRTCIMRSKYRAKLFASLKVISEEAAALAGKYRIEYKGYVVVPIPLSAKRARERGFNQAHLIAHTVAKTFSLICQESMLVRNKETKAQHKKTRQDRFENLKNAFVDSGKTDGAKIVLVDDIYTTGATLLEAARTLYQAGAAEIRCFTLAKEF